MRNSPLTPWQTPTSENWSIDALPRMRVWLLWVVFLVPIMAIAGRLYWLQVVIADRFHASWSRTTETFESLPASDGRILSSDGQVLAFDQPRYEIHVHYRWLEEPVNDDWLTARARENLPRTDRKKRELVETAKAELLAARTELWRSLAQVTNRSAADLTKLRTDIQRRVEAMRTSVAAHRADVHAATSTITLSATWWERIHHELTTPPDRNSVAPLILKEELSPHRLIGDVPVDRIAVIESQPSRFPGVEIRQTSDRVYPLHDVAVHVIGLRTPLREDQASQRKSRYPQGDPLALEVGDRLGQGGIERTYDHHLRGVRGLQRVVRDHAGQIVEQVVTRPSQAGADLTLTIDAAVQRRVEADLDQFVDQSESDSPAGSVIVLDLRTGEVLAAASAPRIALDDQQSPSLAEYQHWSTHPGRPFVSRITQATIPPGSLFYVVTAIAALETGQCTPDELLECQGYLNDPDHDRCALFRQQGIGHGPITLADAIAQSCNVYFFQAAERLGPTPIRHWATRLGFGAPTGIDLLGERSGQLPAHAGARWNAGTTRQFAIGQADLTVTPLQVACLMASIGNGGYAVTPRLTPIGPRPESPGNSIELASAETQLPMARGPQLFSDRTLLTIRRSLELTVSHPQGAGQTAQLPGIPIAAKSGTAEVGQGRVTHAWFAGYVPADKPRYAFVVYLEHGGTGERAAPLAKRVVMSLTEAGLIGAN